MAKGDLFSTVLRGFHKEQVSQYLNDLIRKYEREKEELNKKYEGISPNVVQELRQENDRLRRELEQEKTRNAELEQQKGKISSDHQEDQDLEKLRLLASQIKSRMEEARQMEQAALERRRRELEREKEQVLKEKSVAADLLKQAQKDAEDLRAAAHREQEEMRKTAQQQSEELLQKARTEAAEILQQAKAEKVRQMEQMRDEMIEAKRQLGSMAGRIGNLSQELERFGVLLAQQNEGGSKEKA